MNIFDKVNSWLYLLDEHKHKMQLKEEIKAQQQKELSREKYYQNLKENSTPIRGKIDKIEYVDVSRFDPYRSDWEPEDIILWISFAFENGAIETLQYYHKGSGDPRPEEREILRFSGHPSILECCTERSEVIGYFADDRLVALDNVPPANFYQT